MKKLIACLALIISLSVQPSLSYAIQKALPSGIHSVIERSSAAVVHIAVQHPLYGYNHEQIPGYSKFGSGVIVDAKEGFILTNAHVVDHAKNIIVTLKDGRNKLAQLIGRDLRTDVAVLKIHAKHLTAIPIGDSNKVKIGDWVAAIGSPFGLTQTVTSGMVSALHRYIGLEGDEDFIQTDASINPGNSGGALINSSGKLIGINTAIIGPPGSRGGSVGIGLTIPSNLAKAIMSQFIRYGDIKRSHLGTHIQDLTTELAAILHHTSKDGVLVTRVDPYSSAAKAGIQAEDIILSIDHQPIINANQLSAIVSVIRAGRKVPLTLLRQGKVKTLTVEIRAKDIAHTQSVSYNLLNGVDFHAIKQFNAQEGYITGIAILGLQPNSIAWLAGLRPGDIILSANKQATSNIDLLLSIVHRSPSVLLKIYRGSNILFLVLTQ